MTDKEILPKEIALMLYRDCQLRCKFCYTKGLEINLRTEELMNLYTNIIRSNEAVGHHPRIFVGGLGEPTCGRNLMILERLIREHPNNKFVVFSNMAEPEKSASLAIDHPNLENVVGRIVGENGSDPELEMVRRPSLDDIIQKYEGSGVLDRLKFEILLVSTNLHRTFPTALLEKHGIPYTYAAAVPLGEALKNGLHLNRKEVVEQARLKGSGTSEDGFLGHKNCIIIEEGLTLSGLSVSMCPGALINEVYARYPKRFASMLIDDKEELSKLRRVTSRLIAMKRGKGASGTNMCVGREILYSKLGSRDTSLAGKMVVKTVRDGNLDDLRKSLPLIRSRMPEKIDLSEEEILERVRGRECHIKIAEIGSSLEGIFIWYGPSKTSGECYLWLGAVKESGRRTGSMLMKSVLEDMKLLGYSSVSVKAKLSNSSASVLLEKYGFKPCSVDNDGIVMLMLPLGKEWVHKN